MSDIKLSPEEVEGMLDRAARRGAKEALRSIGLLDDDAHKVGLTIPKRDPYFTEWDQNNYGKAEYPAETGNVIIFPSMMFHETGKNTKDIPRLSISGDIMLTMKEGVKSEHNIPSPATWMKL